MHLSIYIDKNQKRRSTTIVIRTRMHDDAALNEIEDGTFVNDMMDSERCLNAAGWEEVLSLEQVTTGRSGPVTRILFFRLWRLWPRQPQPRLKDAC